MNQSKINWLRTRHSLWCEDLRRPMCGTIYTILALHIYAMPYYYDPFNSCHFILNYHLTLISYTSKTLHQLLFYINECEISVLKYSKENIWLVLFPEQHSASFSMFIITWHFWGVQQCLFNVECQSRNIEDNYLQDNICKIVLKQAFSSEVITGLSLK